MKNDSKIIMDINTMEDIKVLRNTPSVKYLNLNITSPNLEVIYYLLENGKKYSYAEKIDDNRGYIYVPYEIFYKSQMFILDIINNIPTNLTKLEVARYFYITIGKNIGYDINILPEKNEVLNLEIINTINNIWGSIYNKKATNVINNNIKNIGITDCEVLNLDYKKALEYLNNQNKKLDLIFLDPPYATNYIEESLNLIEKYNLLNENGLIICESDNLDRIVYPSSFRAIKDRKYGDKWVVILEKIC